MTPAFNTWSVLWRFVGLIVFLLAGIGHTQMFFNHVDLAQFALGLWHVGGVFVAIYCARKLFVWLFLREVESEEPQ